MDNIKQWHLEEVAGMYKKAISIVVERSKKYATEEDPFLNFRSAASFAGTTVTQGIMTRIGDKLSRLKNTLDRDGEDNEFADESFDDTIVDLCNYFVILRNARLVDRRLAEESSRQLALWEDPVDERAREKAPAEAPTLMKRLASSIGITVE